MLEHQLKVLENNADKWILSLKGLGFYSGKNKYTDRVYRAMFFSAKQALAQKSRLENKGCSCEIELAPVALYLNIHKGE